MKKKIKRKMSMYRMVIDVLNEYQPVWASTPKFVSAHALLNGKFELLQTQAEKERSYTMGVKDTRDSLRAEVAALGARIASALSALGAERDDLELIAQSRITESQLLRYSQGDMIILMGRIRLLMVTHAEALGEFGITPFIIDQFTTKRDEMVANIMAPRKAIVKRKDASSQIVALSEDIDRLLRDKLDKLILVLRPSSESFFTEYTAARMILEYGNGTSGTSDGSETYNNA
ncbi:MAG: hypothetical protein RIT43_1592 [Bacteroidota bacterium]|jgi:hypothetical protein